MKDEEANELRKQLYEGVQLVVEYIDDSMTALRAGDIAKAMRLLEKARERIMGKREIVIGKRYKYKEHDGYIIVLSVTGDRVAYRSEEDNGIYSINKEQFHDFFVMEEPSAVI